VSGDYAAGWLSFLVGLKRVYPKLKAELANRRIDIAKVRVEGGAPGLAGASMLCTSP
jgi:hypothetical protein